VTSCAFGPMERHGAGLVALGVGPARLRRIIEGSDPVTAWRALAAGRHPGDPDGKYKSKAVPSLLESVLSACEATGAAVHVLGKPGYPQSLAGDHEAPAVLFSLGDPVGFDTRARVAIVGTRSATPYGLGVASELGRGLAEAGVSVISGLAPGIDAAAHTGALAGRNGPAVAVIGTAFDVAVSGVGAELRMGLTERGTILSERAPGMAATPTWCFVVRARIMAALAHVVVVVESHRNGGSFHTVKAALDRGVPVAAVPGSVRSSASAGTNALLVEGATPVRDVTDVLALLELVIAGRPEITPPGGSGRKDQSKLRPVVTSSPEAARTLEALGPDPASLDTVVRRTGLPLADVAEALEELAARGAAAGAGGRWSRL
jgi:DNA processing protein